jgi:acetyl-CoA C-acetyltransferase
MRQIAIAGYGITAFGRAAGSTIIDLALDASRQAMGAAGARPEEIDGFYFGTFASAVLAGQNFPAAVIAAQLGLEGVPLAAVESACASGSVAMRQAMNLIAAGDADVALVTGAEKMTAHDTPTVTDALARANATASGSFRAGLTFPGFFALIARAYVDEYGANVDDLADVSVKNRRHGARNEHAQFHAEVTREQVLASRMIADPLHLFDCSPISDGAASLIVASLEWARERTQQPIEILACEQASGATAAEDLRSFTTFPAAAKAASRAFARAGVSPADVDVAEVHDCFSIAEWVALEDLGLVERGCAPAATSSGKTSLGGRIPVNPSGGLLSKGHPIGATGIGQMIEIVRQLRGNADNQVGGAELGLAHNIGGTGGLASVSLFATPR